MRMAIDLAEKGWIPDPVIEMGIRRFLDARLEEIDTDAEAERDARVLALAQQMRRGPIAEHTEDANEQHYEVPADFFRLVLGRNLKYSCCLWEEGIRNLDEAEDAMLELTVERAKIEDGMRILELGCGWGSLSLWMASRFPHSRIHSVSNSASQRKFIEDEAERLGLGNLTVETADMNDYQPSGRFDRVVSVEMFEHMRNYEELLRRIARWLEPDGRLFIHVFCHRRAPYLFEDRGSNDWMARHFFTGGLMPTESLLRKFEGDLEMESSWLVNGRHYEKTARAWLAKQDEKRTECVDLFADVYGADQADRWFHRWRIFFLACAELFGYRNGSEWMVSHTLWRPSGINPGGRS